MTWHPPMGFYRAQRGRSRRPSL
ncbi:unnamed protein product [Spirodela intermedia]|uniref:Uncharacterized protein n=1 Tax=Spirodela intermedia TaxID=51605 RepID=A0A7I8J4F4_SPIIN|nr:unnamed protein product [Spirodela intermedia]CAA6664240.1 unnamed protein product [Spirodela intermedia]